MLNRPDQSSVASRIIARIAWVVPLALLALSIYMVQVARALERTNREGVPAVAEVTRYFRADRKDVTEAELDLVVSLPDGTTLTRKNLTLPYSIAHRVEADTLQVKVLQGADEEVVITSIVGTQIRIAWSNAAMSAIAMLIALVAVFSWNRYLFRKDDPEPEPTVA